MNKTSLTRLRAEQLDEARSASSGRSSHTITGGHDHSLRQTVIALLGGQRLDDHERNGEATVHVLEGRIRLVTAESSVDGSTGDLIEVPDTRHAVEAVEDSVVLLTVAVR
jgi:quercetin dioxygenase-like cupin family protein